MVNLDRWSQVLSSRSVPPEPCLQTPTHKRTLEAQEVEDVAGRVGIAIAGVGLAVDEAVLEAEEVEDVERPVPVAVGVARWLAAPAGDAVGRHEAGVEEIPADVQGRAGTVVEEREVLREGRGVGVEKSGRATASQRQPFVGAAPSAVDDSNPSSRIQRPIAAPAGLASLIVLSWCATCTLRKS